MAKEISHLGQRNAVLDKARGVLLPHIVPVQVDASQCLPAFVSQAAAAPGPSDLTVLYSVRAQNRRMPRRLRELEGFAALVRTVVNAIVPIT